MTPKERAAMQQALVFVESLTGLHVEVKEEQDEIITALREALEQPVRQDPVAWYDREDSTNVLADPVQPVSQEPKFSSNCPKCSHKVISTHRADVWYCPKCQTEWPFNKTKRPVSQEYQDHLANQTFDWSAMAEKHQFMEGYRIGLAEMREACALRAEAYAYMSDNFNELAREIRAIKFEGDTGFRPVSEMIAEHKQDPKKAAAIEKAKMRKATRAEKIAMPGVYEYYVGEFAEPSPAVPVGTVLVPKTEQPVSQEPVCILWEPLQDFWRNNSSIDWDELEFAVKCAVVAAPVQPVNQEPVANVALKDCIYFDSIDFSQTPPYLRYDTGDSTAKENWNVYCDIQEDLRQCGYELTDSGVDHDTVFGNVTPIATPQPVKEVELTDGEIEKITGCRKVGGTWPVAVLVGLSLIAAYKEKNRAG